MSGQSSARMAWLLAGIACLLAFGLWWLRARQASTKITPALLAKAIEALAVTENGHDFQRASDLWGQLLAERPDDRDLLLNQAVTVLKWITDTNSELASGAITQADRQKALSEELAQAYAEADRILKRLADPRLTSGDLAGQIALLESTLLDTRARAATVPEELALRKAAAEKLLAALERQPGQPLLAVRLLELSQELRADWPEIVPRTTAVAYQAWQADPRNLYLLVRTSENLLAEKDARLLEPLEASVELAQPLLSMLPSAQQLSPTELVRETRQAIDAGDWGKAQRIRGWLNVLRASSAFGADHRLVSPHILALLDTAFLDRWRQALPPESPSPDVEALGQYRRELIDWQMPVDTTPAEADSAAGVLVAWYDYDVDRDFDVLAIHGKELRIVPWEDDGLSSAKVALTLPCSVNGFCLADLWTVDSPQRPRRNELSTTGEAAAAGSSSAHDTLQEIIVWGAQQVAIVSRSQDAAGKHVILDQVEGLADLRQVQQIVPIDWDSDGDLDLAVNTLQGLVLLQNNGNRTFQNISQYSQMPDGDWHATKLIACDFDRDLDLDLVACSSSQPHWCVYENILHSQFRFRPMAGDPWQATEALIDASVVELDGNSSWDWSGLSSQWLSVVLTRTPATGTTIATANLSSLAPSGTQFRSLQAGDLNLDGNLDACVASDSGLCVFLGNGHAFQAEPTWLVPAVNVTQLDLQDADRDGQLEVLVVADGRPQLVRSESSGQRSHSITARVRGIADVNGGGRINHYAIGSVLELWSRGRYQARVIQSPVTHFGLADQEADNLRIIFTNGLTQNVLQPQTDKLLEEVQELRGSCPFVYGWNGQHFELITDLLWNAPLGLQVARGQVLPDRRWEHLLLPGHLMQPKDGAIELRVTEELWEVAYFDQLELTVVDHPDSTELWTNEKVGPPDLAQPGLFAVSRPIMPVAASDGYQRNVLDRIANRDQVYVQAFQRQICQGLCEPHTLELTFDPQQLKHRSEFRLVLTGWMYPTDTSLNIGISQNPERQPPAPPSLWVPNAAGEFVCVQPFMGFPGGKPKTIVIDVSQQINRDDPRLRIASSQQIYWDAAYLMADEPPTPLLREVLPLETAELHYRGFSELMPRASDQPHWYDYRRVRSAAKWPPLAGPFSRFGSVRPQLVADDDRLVVMTSGDEIVLRFRAPTRPLRPGWRRDYVLHSVGWDKDADANTLEGHSSMPLPFAAMQAYPPPIEQAEDSQRVWQLNAPTFSDRSLFPSYWHPTAPAQ